MVCVGTEWDLIQLIIFILFVKDLKLNPLVEEGNQFVADDEVDSSSQHLKKWFIIDIQFAFQLFLLRTLN